MVLWRHAISLETIVEPQYTPVDKVSSTNVGIIVAGISGAFVVVISAVIVTLIMWRRFSYKYNLVVDIVYIPIR